MPTREQIVIEARSWEGTKWEHQGMSKGQGVDCEGFVEGVALNTGIIELAIVVRNYRRRETNSVMLSLLDEYLDFVAGNETREPPDMSDVLPADVVAFCDERLAVPSEPRHLGIITKIRHDGVIYVIHAAKKVTEHRLDHHFLSRIHSVWRVRGLVT